MRVNKAKSAALAAILPSIAGASCSSGTPIAEPTESSNEVDYDQENSLGRWCFKPSNLPVTWYVIEIVDSENPVAIYSFQDGSGFEELLDRKEDGRLKKRDGQFGDEFEVTGKGELAVYDEQGFIHAAERVPPSAANSSCF